MQGLFELGLDSTPALYVTIGEEGHILLTSRIKLEREVGDG
jgi:hypothetical protein